MLKNWLLICVLIMILGCSYLDINVEPVLVTVTGLSACKGINENEEFIGISTVFKSTEERIFVCGQIETLDPVNLELYWYYQDELVFKQVAEGITDGFYNYVEPNNSNAFPPGSYRIDVLFQGSVLRSAEFTIE